ncbi:GNAT family N-acetyltransferase [Aliiroseovarius halocynthiae]|nr:GNAT family N-acetyltransferase [Aliiroseovarius halocynthiae]
MAAFSTARGWSAKEIAGLLTSPHVFTATIPDGFVMGRVIVDEAELLTIAVSPAAQGQGFGATLLADFERIAFQRGATRALLEVATDNFSALALYRRAGWIACGSRHAYYTRPDGTTCDAVLMERHLT